MNKLILKQEVLDAYDAYVKAFIKGDTKEVENYLRVFLIIDFLMVK